MRKFGLNNILGSQVKKTTASTSAGIDDNPTPEKVQQPTRKYSAYRTILTRHNETAARLRNQPSAAIEDEPLPFDTNSEPTDTNQQI